MADNLPNCRRFIRKTGYPVVAKPDNGVGASHTFRIENDKQLIQFFQEKPPETSYIMEEFINAEVNSYDAIIDSNGDPMFETGNVTLVSIMDVVNTKDNAKYYIVKELPEDIREAGRAAVKSFGVKSRFIHFEFFRLLADHEGLGKKGDLMALEVNMRPCGGFTPDVLSDAMGNQMYVANFVSREEMEQFYADVLKENSTKI